MIGLGCGAFLHASLHYSLDYAVRPKSVKDIIADYLARSRDELAHAEHGFTLDTDEQKRRYLLQSILNVEGLESARYTERFGTDPSEDFPDLRAFAELRLARVLRCRKVDSDAVRVWNAPTCSGRGSFRRSAGT